MTTPVERGFAPNGYIIQIEDMTYEANGTGAWALVSGGIVRDVALPPLDMDYFTDRMLERIYRLTMDIDNLEQLLESQK